MAMLKKEICAACGKEIGITERVRLADGKCICNTCVKKCETTFVDKFLKKHTCEDYLEYLEHRKENLEKIKQFQIDAIYFDRILVDFEHGWFVFGEKKDFTERSELLAMNPEVFEGKDLVFWDISYNIKSEKEGIFSDKVKADVMLKIAFNNKWYPYAFNDRILKNHKHRAELARTVFGKSVIETDDEQSEFEAYLNYWMDENGVNVPHKLGKGFVFKVDLEPYATYLDKLFELRQLGVYTSFDFGQKLELISRKKIIRFQIKRRFGRDKKLPAVIANLLTAATKPANEENNTQDSNR